MEHGKAPPRLLAVPAAKARVRASSRDSLRQLPTRDIGDAAQLGKSQGVTEEDLDWDTAMRVADESSKRFADQHTQLIDRVKATSLTGDEVRAIGARAILLAREGVEPQGATLRGSSGAGRAGVGAASAGAATAPDRSRTPRNSSKGSLPSLPVVISSSTRRS